MTLAAGKYIFMTHIEQADPLLLSIKLTNLQTSRK